MDSFLKENNLTKIPLITIDTRRHRNSEKLYILNTLNLYLKTFPER